MNAAVKVRSVCAKILLLTLGISLGSALVLLVLGTAVAARDQTAHSPSAPQDNWPMFHHDPQHSGVATAVPGSIDKRIGPVVRWRYKVADIPSAEVNGTRWTSTFPLGDLDGDRTAEIIVGSYDGYIWALGGGPRLYLPLVFN